MECADAVQKDGIGGLSTCCRHHRCFPGDRHRPCRRLPKAGLRRRRRLAEHDRKRRSDGYDALAKAHPLGRVATPRMSSRPCSIWRTRHLSPARSCTWTEVKVPDTDALRDALERWKAGIDA